MAEKIFRRVVLTGAAGRLGTVLRPMLAQLTETLVVSDRNCPSLPLAPNELFVPCDLADHVAVGRLLADAECIVHFGGEAGERPFERILPANIVGQFNIYDHALRCGVSRIVLASSNHVTGCYPVTQQVVPEMPMRPDSLYAVSKGYGELLARFYHDRHGLESVCLRIGNCTQRPRTPRALHCWLSHSDLCELVRCALLAPRAGFAVVYGVSDNRDRWWGDDDAGRIGFHPRDSSEAFRDELPASTAPAAIWQGGSTSGIDYRYPETLPPEGHQGR